MNFNPSFSFLENLALFQAEAEHIDADCARILFDNLDLLLSDGDTNPNRPAVQKFNQAILAVLESLPESEV